jgi:hypothetical protein
LDIFAILIVYHLVYMQDFYRLVGGFEEHANKVQETVCKKLMLGMHYEAQIQCIINYSASKLAKKMSKAEARTIDVQTGCPARPWPGPGVARSLTCRAEPDP